MSITIDPYEDILERLSKECETSEEIKERYTDYCQDRYFKYYER